MVNDLKSPIDIFEQYAKYNNESLDHDFTIYHEVEEHDVEHKHNITTLRTDFVQFHYSGENKEVELHSYIVDKKSCSIDLNNTYRISIKDYYNKKLTKLRKNAIIEIEQKINKNVNGYENYLKMILSNIKFIKSINNNMLQDLILENLEKIEIYFSAKYLNKIPYINKKTSNNKSTKQSFFVLKFKNNLDNEINLKKVYKILTRHDINLISCTQKEFTDALSTHNPKNKIKWIVKGKSRYISKASLLYFIISLNRNNILSYDPSKDDHMIRNSFNANGKEIRKLSSSKKSLEDTNSTSKRAEIDIAVEEISKI